MGAGEGPSDMLQLEGRRKREKDIEKVPREKMMLELNLRWFGISRIKTMLSNI